MSETPNVTPAPVVPEHNPYAPYGLDASGNPLPAKPEPAKPADATAEVAELKAQVAQLGEKLKVTESVTKQAALVDKVIKAISGEGDKTSPQDYRAIFEDLKKISPPGVRQALELLEKDPEALNRMTGSLTNLQVNQLVGVNMQAHQRVVDLAKKAGFKADNPTDMNKMVFPFERAITEVINANPKLKEAFVNGNVEVVDEVFNSLVSPHIAQRLREKKARQERSSTTKTPPFGKAQPQATEQDKPDAKPNIRTPQGRAAFHKAAVNRFFDKAMSRDEE
jgi:hypothetical protein